MHARRSVARALDPRTTAPVISGASTVAPGTTTPSGGLFDPSNSVGAPDFPTPTSTPSSSTSVSPSTSQSPAQTSSAAPASHTNTIIIAASVAAAAAFALLALILLCVCRRKRQDIKSRKHAGRSEPWNTLESANGHPPPVYNHDSFTHSQDWERKGAQSHDQPPMLNANLPAQGDKSFLTMKSAQSLPHANVRPPPPGRVPSGEYAASYLRSIYSGYDAQSIKSTSSRGGGSRRSLRKSKSTRELIAMEKLIAALDISAEEEKARQRLGDPAASSHQRSSDYIPTDFPLPPTAVFRAALGATEWEH